MAPMDSNNASTAATLAAGVAAGVEEYDDSEAEETPEFGQPVAEDLSTPAVSTEPSAQPVASEPASPAPAPWSPEPERVPQPAATEPALEPDVTQRFQLSGEVTGPPAAPEPVPAAPVDKPDSGTPDQ